MTTPPQTDGAPVCLTIASTPTVTRSWEIS